MKKAFKSVTKTLVVAFGLSGSMTVASYAAHCSTKPFATGKASWYKAGVQTANGEPFAADGISAAHRSLPFGSRVKVINLQNHKEIIVRINDRGPFVDDRIIDLSRGAAKKLNYIDSGVTNVQIFRCS